MKYYTDLAKERQEVEEAVKRHTQLIDEQQQQLLIISNQALSIKGELEAAQALSRETTARQEVLNQKLDGFYGKLIEIFGLFIAVFSFIIAGIQVATKATGGFWNILAFSCGVFIPITLCIFGLLWMIRWTTRR